jgi:AcrR family transcriptional regulator
VQASIAVAEFADSDYRSASVSNIVALAGIAKGSFYQYSEDKKDLYLYLIRLSMEEKQRLFAEQPRPGETGSVFDVLRSACCCGVSRVIHRQLLHRSTPAHRASGSARV